MLTRMERTTRAAKILRRSAKGSCWLSSLADATSRVLQEGAAMNSMPGPSLSALRQLTAASPPQPVSLLMLKSYAVTKSPQHRLLQAKYIHKEMIARRAHILTLLHLMPEPLAGDSAVVQLAGVYWERLRGLLSEPEPETEADERLFFAASQEANQQILTRCSPTNPLSEEQMSSLSASPLRIDLKLPATDANAAAAAAACEAAVERWLGWMEGAAEMKRELGAGAKQTQVYARDTKLRAVTYGWLLDRYSSEFGDEGKMLTQADAGPLDEACNTLSYWTHTLLAPHL